MSNQKRVLIIGSGIEGKTSLAIARLKEQYGDDVLVYTSEEAKEQGLNLDDFENMPPMKITAPPLIPIPMIMGGPSLSGRAKRRERRKQQRKNGF